MINKKYMPPLVKRNPIKRPQGYAYYIKKRILEEEMQLVGAMPLHKKQALMVIKKRLESITDSSWWVDRSHWKLKHFVMEMAKKKG